MITKSCELDVELIEALETEMKNKKLPLHIQTGIMFRTKCGDLVMPVQIDCPDDFDLDTVLCEVINRTYNLQ